MKLKIMLLLIVVFVVLIYCGGGSQKPDNNVSSDCKIKVGDIIIEKYLMEQPNWVSEQPKFGQLEDNETYMFIYGTAEGNNPNDVLQDAKANASSDIAQSINQAIIDEYLKMTEKYQVDKQEFEKGIRKTLTATKSKAKVSGVITAGEFTGVICKVTQVKPDCAKQCNGGKDLYLAKVRKAMPKEDFKQYIKQIKGELEKDGYKEFNETQKKLLEEVNKKMEELDTMLK